MAARYDVNCCGGAAGVAGVRLPLEQQGPRMNTKSDDPPSTFLLLQTAPVFGDSSDRQAVKGRGVKL